MLSESLRAVISQSLLKKVGGGRIAAHEIMVGTPAIRNLIREDKVAQMYSSIQTGAQYGMQTLDQCLLDLVKRGLVTRPAREPCEDKRDLRVIVRGPARRRQEGSCNVPTRASSVVQGAVRCSRLRSGAQATGAGNEYSVDFTLVLQADGAHRRPRTCSSRPASHRR